MNDDLSQTLLDLAAVMSRVAAGTYPLTPECVGLIERALDKAALQALALEAGRDARAERPDLAALRDGLRSGRVVLLETPYALHTIGGDLAGDLDPDLYGNPTPFEGRP